MSVFLPETGFNQYTFSPSYEQYIKEFSGEETFSCTEGKNEKEDQKERRNVLRKLKSDSRKSNYRKDHKQSTITESEKLHDAQTGSKQQRNPRPYHQGQVSVACGTSKIPYQRFSLLNKHEHLKYMEYFLSRIGIGPPRVANMDQIKRIELILAQEQREFQSFLQNFAMANPQLYNNIQKDLISKVKLEFLSHVNKIKRNFQGNFESYRVFGFPQNSVVTRAPVMTYVETIFNKDKISVFRCPHPGEEIPIHSKNSMFPNGAKDEMKETKSTETMLHEMNSNIFIPSSTLLVLVNNHAPNFSEEWRIPFTVSEKNGAKTVVFNEPMTIGRLTVREACRMAAEASMEEKCTSLVKKRVADILYDTTRSDNTTREDVPAGNVASVKNAQSSNTETNVTNEHLAIRDPSLGKWPHVSRRVKDSKSSAGGTEEISGVFSYDVWELGQFRIVCAVDFLQAIFCGDYTITELPYLVLVYPKMEFQVEHGFEQFSLSELGRMWWMLFLSQPSKLVCCRIDSRTCSIQDARFYSMSDFTVSGSPFNPQNSNKLLFEILKEAYELPVGDYLMKHENGNINIVIYKKVYKKQHADGLYCVEKDIEDCICNSWPMDLTRVDWLPVDPWSPTRRHINTMTIPCTFPINFNVNNKGQHRRGGGKGGKGNCLRNTKKMEKKKRADSCEFTAPRKDCETFF